jgi:glycosyltransferase involved in cell wall biosynthesis
LITLVSYPRSGNTFLRNVLFEVYGLKSTTYLTGGHGPDDDWKESSIVKTHHLPDELPQELNQRKIVYLIRDGRDSMVSFAHHRKDVVSADSSFEQNLEEAIRADEGSHFGGWSEHASEWIKRADLVIRFEDLIVDPIGQCERMRSIFELPAPNTQNLPDFQSLKTGRPEYGSGKYVDTENLASHWFRRGKVGAWKDEMTQDQKDLFWHLHGEAMEVFGYEYDLAKKTHFHQISKGLIGKVFEGEKKIRVLIEGSKLVDPFTDGIKRYLEELLKAANRFPVSKLEVTVLVNGQLLSLKEAVELSQSNTSIQKTSWLIPIKKTLRVVLPKSWFNQIARFASIQKIHSLKRRMKTKNEALHFDVLFLPLPQNYEAFGFIQFNRVVATIHDVSHALFPTYHEDNNVRLATAGINWLEEQNADLVAVSDFTSKELQSQELTSEVIHEGVDRSRFFPVKNEHPRGVVRDRYNLPKGNFLLSVCTLEPRKNLQGLIAAFASLDEKTRENFPLVLAGRKGWKWDDQLVPIKCKSQVHFIGFVREDHLPTLYSLAYSFVYVSHYEGFGLPVLEAMACSCPVVVSENSSLSEIAGDAGVLVNAISSESIRTGILELIQSQDLRNELGKKARKRSWDFSWAKCWDMTANRLIDETSSS